MTDLRQRFRSLDSVPTPDLWSEVEQLAAQPSARSGSQLWSAMLWGGTAAIVLVTALSFAWWQAGSLQLGGAPSSRPTPPSPAPMCGDVVVTNRVEQPAEGGQADEEVLTPPYLAAEEEVLTPPYVAVMGLRTISGEQFAELTVRPARAWGIETVLVSLFGPGGTGKDGSVEDGGFDRGGTEFRVGTPGDWHVVLTDPRSTCRAEITLRVEVDDVLRASDAENGLTQPPPPAGDAPRESD